MIQTQEVKDPEATTAVISGLSANTTYYISIAAKNEKGLGEFSDIVSAKTDSESGSGSGGVPAVVPAAVAREQAMVPEQRITPIRTTHSLRLRRLQILAVMAGLRNRSIS